MKPRMPLYARALALLAVNLLLLIVLFFAWGGWGTLLSASARERLTTISEALSDELGRTPREQWPAVLRGYSERYGAEFSTTGPKGPPGGGPPPFAAHGFDHPRGDRAPQPPVTTGRRGDRIDLRDSGWRGPYRLFIPTLLRMQHGAQPLDVIVTARSLPQLAAFIGISEWMQIALLAVGLSALLWAPFIVRLTRSVARVQQATQRIADGHFDVRVDARSRDELGLLADSVNHLAMRLQDFVSGQKRFLADVAHETISPLARLQVGLGLLESELPATAQGTLRDVQDDAQQMSALLNELLLFSRAGLEAERVAPSAVSLFALADEALQREDASAPVHIDAAAGEPVALAHRALLLRALCNLIRNAQRHGDGTLELRITRNGDARLPLSLRVSDRGPGVPEEALAKLGQPFYRPDAARSRDSGGYGLGLAIVRRCVESCGGELRLRNRAGGGFEAEIRLASA